MSPAIFLTALLAAQSANPCSENIDVQRAIATDKAVIHGLYRYADGDRLVYNCGGGTCSDFLIRDQYLQDHIKELVNRWITVEVTRVDSCGKEGSRFACIRNGGSALHIIRWVDPKPG